MTPFAMTPFAPHGLEATDTRLLPVWTTDRDGRPGRTPGQAEGEDPPEEVGQTVEDTASQATPDQAEGEEEDA
jgi:hypothetical protein